MSHQFSLFGYQRPVKKVPISRAKLEEAKRLIENGDDKGAAARMREIRERLEDFERRL